MKRKQQRNKNRTSCKTVAIRFYFDFKVTNGKANISFLSHKVIVHKIEKPKETVTESKEVVFVNDIDYLRSLRPSEWKHQDHYRVLGISNMRYDAPGEAIRTAYRSLALKHHPDKRSATGPVIKSDQDYFICITMAYETLNDVTRRRAYDSVDPEFDNSLPSANGVRNNFYQIFNHYFQLNSRWSERQPVPKFGGDDALRVDVDNFYKFWYDFKSWREYSYQDEEDKNQCSDRYERRECEKINKAERQRKKRDEMLRIRTLVDMAYNSDPRIVRFKQQDKEKKSVGKVARQAAAQAKKDKEEELIREKKAAADQLLAEERAQVDAKRSEREAQKKALRRQRKMFRDTCKANDYYTQDKDEILPNVQAVENICQKFTVLQLKDLNTKLQSNGRETFLQAVKDCDA